MSMRVVTRMGWLHLIRQLRVVSNDVVNLVLRIRIVVHIGNSTLCYESWFAT